MAWKFNNEKAIYLQIMDMITMDIISGKIPLGTKFNSVREMAIIAGVNPNTMQKALSDLEQDGLLVTNRTNGRYITEDEGLLHQLKERKAATIICDYVANMKNIGFSRDEILQLTGKLMDKS